MSRVLLSYLIPICKLLTYASTAPTPTKPILVGTGGGDKLSIFPSSVHRVPGGEEIIVIAQGNPDQEMPLGGFGREFATKDMGATWREVGPATPTDGNPRKGVACITRTQDLLCLPFRFDPTASPRVGVATALQWSGSPPAIVGNKTVTVTLFENHTGGASGLHWGMIPDMDAPVDIQMDGKQGHLLSLYGQYDTNDTSGIKYHLITVASFDEGLTWSQVGVIKDNSGIDADGSCSNPSEDAMVRLPDGRLAVLYRNRDGAGTGWSENIPLCMQFSSDEGRTWTVARKVSSGPRGVEPKAAVVGGQLVVLTGRDGLYAWSVSAAQVDSGVWTGFNIAQHHNAFFKGTDLAFSDATVAGTGGSDETTGYMGLHRLNETTALICYDRTTSHASNSASRLATSMADNNVFCFQLAYTANAQEVLV